MSWFRVEAASVDGVERVSVQGEFDRADLAVLEKALHGSDGRPVVIDLRECEFIDSSGIALIVEWWHEKDGRLALAGAEGQAARILEMTGLSQTIATHDDFAAAAAAVGRG
jgi:anti-anti-sigma factor